MSRPWTRSMPTPPEKIMIHNPTTSSLRDSQANRAVNRHFHKCAALMSRVSNNIGK